MSEHVQCEDCGKCRVIENEDFCWDCEYRSCERGPDCADEKPINSVRDLLGIAHDWTDGMSSVDWVRAQRDRT
ncbi:hypothetical protein [Pseudarthrobacter sp. LMD1-1-1.1]|uniref:hypothetical protein n=1 Tax=Pseudarthrobacter sp. LMD1-1-1.1 TaxID=3135242 RepID=UPI00342323D0